MWIRTQDRFRLIDCTNLLVFVYELKPAIYEETSQGRVLLAVYETKERALQVLDEIQSYIDYGGKTIEVFVQSSGRSTTTIRPSIIYEMPKE